MCFLNFKSEFFSLLHPNLLVQSFVIPLLWTSCPLVLPLLRSPLGSFSQCVARIDPRRGTPLLAMAAHPGYVLSGYSPGVYKPTCVVTTHRGARARSRPCLPQILCEIPLLLASFPFPHLGNKVSPHEIYPPRQLQVKGQGFSLHIFPDLWYYHVIIHKD